MKNIGSILRLTLFFVAGSLYGQTNLVTNGGFESGTNNWTLDAGGGSTVSYSIDNTSPQEGSNCLHAVVSVLGSNSWSVQIKNAFGPVVEGHIYRATIWAKSATAGSTINYTIGKATAGYDEYAASYGVALTTGWRQYQHEFTAEVSTTNDITLALHITGTDDYWFDDFRVWEVVDEINSATINTAGNRVVLDFNINLTPPESGEQMPFLVYSTENNYFVSEVLPLAESDKLNLNLDERVLADEEITVEYIPGTLRSSAGIEVQAFTIEAVNNSAYTEPIDNLETKQSGGLRVYPTIVSDLINIELNNGMKISLISLLDQSGRIIQSTDSKPDSDCYSMNIDHLRPGIYFIRVMDSAGNVYNARIIKN
jgi:hypothetical protein